VDIFEAFPATAKNPNGFSREPIPEINNYMSYSRIKTMAKSMADYEWRYIKGNKPEDTPEKEFGRLVHNMILESDKFAKHHSIRPSREDFENLLDTVSDLKEEFKKILIKTKSSDTKPKLQDWLVKIDPFYRKRIWRFIEEDYEKTLPKEAVSLSAPQYDHIVAMNSAIDQKVIKHKMARDLITNGFPEVCAYWHDEELEVTWFIRLDYLKVNPVLDTHLFWATDLKTTKNGSPLGFSKDVAKWGYHFQNWIYHRVVTGITGCKVNMVNIAVEKVEPIGVGVYEPIMKANDTAGFQIRNLLRDWRECHAKGRWPKYEERIVQIGPPNWYYWQVEEQADMEGDA